MIKKQFVKSRNVTKVTFAHPADVQADAVELISDLSEWRPIRFERLKSGAWRLVQELEPGRRMQFRYLVHRDGSVDYWNDPEADAFVANGAGSENAVVAG